MKRPIEIDEPSVVTLWSRDWALILRDDDGIELIVPGNVSDDELVTDEQQFLTEIATIISNPAAVAKVSSFIKSMRIGDDA